MTLSTDFLIFDEVDPEEVYAKCSAMVGGNADTRVERTEGRIVNGVAQGLDAWLWVHHGKLAHNEWCEEDCAQPAHESHRVRVNFDTGYGYKGPLGGCTELHAMYVLDLGEWCDERGLRWAWVNAFTGELHHGRDGLSEFLESGDDAAEWFTNVVKPFIESRGGEIV